MRGSDNIPLNRYIEKGAANNINIASSMRSPKIIAVAFPIDIWSCLSRWILKGSPPIEEGIRSATKVPETTISKDLMSPTLYPSAEIIDFMRKPQKTKENKWITSAVNIYPGRISLTNSIVFVSRVKISTTAIENILIKIDLVNHLVYFFMKAQSGINLSSELKKKRLLFLYSLDQIK